MSNNKCVHYWLCAVANGNPTSRSECKFCGLVQYFLNYIEGEDVKRFEKEPYHISEILPSSRPILSL